MKQLFAIVAIFAAFTCKAQSNSTTLAGAAHTLDTISTSSSTDTVDLYSPLTDNAGKKYFSGTNGVWSTQFTATKISGTATANALLQATVNGTDWVNLTSTSADTMAVANSAGAQTKMINASGKKIIRARWRVLAPSSTQAVQTKASWLKD